jgi:hypothetical protein
MSKRFHIFVDFIWIGCHAVQHHQMLVQVGKNSVEKLSSNEFSILHSGKRTVLRDVLDVVWLEDEPYFYLAHGKILKWDKSIVDDAFAFNLQKVANRLYFVKEYAADAEPCSMSLNIIDATGYKEIVIKKSGKPELFEDYFVLYPNEIYVVPWGKYFALIDSVGHVIKTYDLNRWGDKN